MHETKNVVYIYDNRKVVNVDMTSLGECWNYYLVFLNDLNKSRKHKAKT